MGVESYIRPRAKHDLIEQALYIARQDPDAADRFLNALEQAFDTLANMPEMGALRHLDNPALEGIRMWPIKGFEKHLIFYRPIDGGIEVIRILNAARDIENILKAES